MSENRLTQKEAVALIAIAAGIGAAGVLGAEGAKWAKKKLEHKDPKKWWKSKVEPFLLYAGFETSRRVAAWFDKRVVTVEELKPGLSSSKRAMAADRIRIVANEMVDDRPRRKR